MNVPVPVNGIEDVDVLGCDPDAELLAAHGVGGSDEEVDDLDGGVDDAEAFHHVFHGRLEEPVVDLAKHVHFGGRGECSLEHGAHGAVGAGERAQLFFEQCQRERRPTRRLAGRLVVGGEVGERGC